MGERSILGNAVQGEGEKLQGDWLVVILADLLHNEVVPSPDTCLYRKTMRILIEIYRSLLKDVFNSAH
jgi:hypothetical protein